MRKTANNKGNNWDNTQPELTGGPLVVSPDVFYGFYYKPVRFYICPLNYLAIIQTLLKTKRKPPYFGYVEKDFIMCKKGETIQVNQYSTEKHCQELVLLSPKKKIKLEGGGRSSKKPLIMT